MRQSRLMSATHAVMLLCLLGIAAYANTFRAPFIFDDIAILTRNPGIRSVFPIALSPRWLVNLSFQLNYLVHGYDVGGYHVVNLAIHIAGSLLLFGIVRHTLSSASLRAAFGSASVPLAFTVAALWLVHPLQTESVTYVCQRYESLMGLCLLGTLYAFIRATSATNLRTRRLWTDAAVIVCALGMGTKEVMVTAPLIVWLYDALFTGGSWAAPWRERRGLHTALFLTIGILVMFELLMLGRSLDADQDVTGGVSPALYLATQAEVILHYLKLSLLPRGLCLDYAWPVAAGWGQVWGAALVLALLGLAGLWALARRRAAGFVIVVFFVLLAPTSSVLPVPDMAFEHRMYLPLACVLGLLVPGAWRVLAGRLRPAIPVALAAVLIVTLTGLTLARNRDYRSELAMWAEVAARRPANLRARIEFAVALAEAGRDAEAARQFQAVLDAIPPADRARFARGEVSPGRFSTMSPRYHYFRAHANYGRLLARDPATRGAAIEHYVLALRAAPRHPAVEAYLRDALREAGIPEDRIDGEMMARILAIAPRS